ncbi:MAG: cell envelope integrity protein TolA [Gammaproteobacteria bacterium]
MLYSPRTLTESLLLHALLIGGLGLSVDFAPEEIRRPATRREIVQATVVDQQAVAAEMERLEAAEERERRAERERIAAAEREAKALEDKRRAEEQRLKELAAERARLKKEKEAAAKRRAEAEEKAAAARREAAEAERRKAEAEAARKAEQAKREAAAAAAREAERKRREQELQDALAAEEAALAAAEQAAADSREIDRYVAAIAQRVRQSFTILPGHDGLSCTLRIKLIPGGEVAGVAIVKSSGNDTFDRQAETAVRKAAPLPVPTEPRLFQQMRSITFVFDPQS